MNSLDLAVSEFLSFDGAVDNINNRNKFKAVVDTIRHFGYYDGMSKQEFVDTSILLATKLALSSWRKGQSVFNYIDMFFNIARHIQINTHVDCFYDDSKINDFLSEAYAIISKNSSNNSINDTYAVERLIGEKWYLKTNEMPFKSCEAYINEHLKESPRAKYRIIKTHTDIIGEYTGKEDAVPSKKIIRCHMCDKVIVKNEDPIYIYHRVSEDGEGGCYSNDVICCSKECALSAAEYDICEHTVSDNSYEYRNAGWYDTEEDEL